MVAHAVNTVADHPAAIEGRRRSHQLLVDEVAALASGLLVLEAIAIAGRAGPGWSAEMMSDAVGYVLVPLLEQSTDVAGLVERLR